MSAKDKYYDIVRAALESDGWLITDDPLRIEIGDRAIKIDLGAERLIAAEKGEEKIAVEIKSFVGVSQLQDFYMALGQFSYYQVALEKTEPERKLFLAVPDVAYTTFFEESMTKEVIRRYKVRLLVYKDRLMGKIKAYKDIVRGIIEETAQLGAKPDSPVQTQVIKDEEGGHYLLFSNGWRGSERVYGCYLHIDITPDGKVWVQHDGTDIAIAEKLVEKGIPKTDIILGFHAPFVREDTGFAVA